MDLYIVLGWINFALVLFNLSYFFIKLVYRNNLIKNKEKRVKFREIIKRGSLIHRINGILIIVIAVIHAYLIFGNIFYFHTGLILLIFIILNLFIFILGRLKVLKKWLLAHKLTAIIIFIFLLIHLINPWLFG